MSLDKGVFVFHTVLEGCVGAILLARGAYVLCGLEHSA